MPDPGSLLTALGTCGHRPWGCVRTRWEERWWLLRFHSAFLENKLLSNVGAAEQAS